MSVLGIKGSESIEQVVNVIRGMTQENAIAAMEITNLSDKMKAQALCDADICKTMDEAKEAVNSYAQSTSATAAANATAAASEDIKSTAVDGTAASNVAEAVTEQAKAAAGAEGVAANVAEAGSEVTASVATDASAVSNVAEAVTEQAKAAAGAEATVANGEEAISEEAAAGATRDHAKANLEAAATEKTKQATQKQGIQVTSKLGSALKGLLTNKYVWIAAAIAAAIGGIVLAYKKANPSIETLAERLDEAKQKVQESTQKIEEMESELSNVKSRITELQGMGSLSIVQQQELANLEKMGSQLERNIELVKEKRRLETKEANMAFVEWFEKDIYDKSEYGYIDYGTGRENKGNAKNSFWGKAGLLLSSVALKTLSQAAGVNSSHIPTYNSYEEDLYVKDRFDEAKELIKKKNEEITLEEKEKIDERLEEIEKYYIDKTSEWEKR